MKISIRTLGCKVNQAESSLIEGSLKSRGHKIVDLSENPHVCIINTCTVTSKSDYQSRQLIRRAHRAGAKVIVTGCYSDLNRDQVMSMTGVTEVIENRQKLGLIGKLSGNMDESFLCRPSDTRSRLFIKIQDGCNYSCSYCIIPKARGHSRSISPDAIIKEVNNAVALGYNEVVLTGIHLGTYGLDLKPKVNLSKILLTLLNKTIINRIRLSSIEVNEIDEELLELFMDRRVCKHLHIPLQSGDDRILKLMRRTYNAKKFCSKIEHTYKKVRGVCIGTDVIVGFPGEGECEFKNTYNLLESLPFSYLHVFPFSKRPGTTASEMPDNTTSRIKKDRAHVLEHLNKMKKQTYMQQQIGKTLDVLVEESNSDGTCSGTTGNYLKIRLLSNSIPRGATIFAEVTGINQGRLHGIPI